MAKRHLQRRIAILSRHTRYRRRIKLYHGKWPYLLWGICSQDCCSNILGSLNVNITAASYFEDVLQPTLLSCLDNHPDTHFPQDNARHGNLSRRFLISSNIHKIRWGKSYPFCTILYRLWHCCRDATRKHRSNLFNFGIVRHIIIFFTWHFIKI